MMKSKFAWLILTVTAIIGCTKISETEQTLTRLEDGVLRLHILANSDSAADQNRKMLVRDALLARSTEWMTESHTRREAIVQLEKQLPQIEAIAEETLRSAGCSDTVRATVCKTEFPSRAYDEITLPAGNYEALRIEIGEGAGQNWWCVMYPTLCVPAAAAESMTDAEVMEMHFDAAVCDMAMHPEDYEIRLKCVELWRDIKGAVRTEWEKLKEEKGDMTTANDEASGEN